MRQIARFLVVLALAAVMNPPQPGAAEGGWKDVGVRGGFSANAGQMVHQYELFTAYQLPWQLPFGAGWKLTTRVNGAAGAMHGGGTTGGIFSVGPGIGLEWNRIPIDLDGGISAAFLTEDTFGSKDLNGDVQFISHIGVNLRILKGWGVGYNFQHMSNANMNGSRNPGINMHMFSLIWFFGR